MGKRALWPLLPPACVLGLLWIFLAIARQAETSSPNGGLVCVIHQTTGLYCPGCGGTRCARAIAQGDWFTALSHNPLLLTGFVAFMACSAFLIIRVTLLGKPVPALPAVTTRLLWLTAAATGLFTVLRNIPAYPFSLLAP